jgi:hypothetical protein
MKTWEQIAEIINAKQLLSGALAVFMLVAGVVKANALEREGVVTQKRYNEDILEIFIDTDPNTPGAEHIITIPSIYTTNGTIIDEFTDKGTIIRFDDEKGATGGRYVRNPSSSIISIDGTNIIDIVGDREAVLYPYANKARQREATHNGGR